MSWQPISSFEIPPFDKEHWTRSSKRVLIVKRGGSVSIGRYSYTERGRGRWQDAVGYNCEPSHWQPLPDPPAEKEQAKLPDWDDLRGKAPDATANLSSEDFVRTLRDEWE